MELFAQVVWIFPKFETIYLFYLFLIGVAAFLYVRLMNYLQGRQKSRVNHWNELQKFALARKCSQKDISILRKFYDSLTEEERELYLLPENRNKLKNALYRFFLRNNENPTEREVEVFDKLFRSGSEFRKEILGLADLVIGEVAALEADGKEDLTYVMQKTETELLLSAKGISPELLVPGKETKLYVFRPTSGGYLLSGKVVKANSNGLVFLYSGKIERKGESHLMLLEKVRIEISPWPPKNQESSVELDRGKLLLTEENIDKQIEILKRIASEQRKKEDSPKFHIQEEAKAFSTFASRLSDRGLLFAFPPGLSSDVWKYQDLWEVSFTLGPEHTFHLHGKMMPTKQKSDEFLLKFVDSDETMRKELYQIIKELGGVRESLT